TDVLFVNRRAPDFSDDLESGASSFTTSLARGSGPWRLVESPLAHSPTHVYEIDSTDAQKDASLTLENVALRPSPTTIAFRHRFDTEGGFDGGRLLIREEPGGAYVDVGSRIVEGGYNGVVSGGNPLGAGPAWTGKSGEGFSLVVVDVSDRPNQIVDVRWRF